METEQTTACKVLRLNNVVPRKLELGPVKPRYRDGDGRARSAVMPAIGIWKERAQGELRGHFFLL